MVFRGRPKKNWMEDIRKAMNRQSNFLNKTFSINVFKQYIMLRMSSAKTEMRATGNYVDYLEGRSGPQRGVQMGGRDRLAVTNDAVNTLRTG